MHTKNIRNNAIDYVNILLPNGLHPHKITRCFLFSVDFVNELFDYRIKINKKYVGSPEEANVDVLFGTERAVFFKIYHIDFNQYGSCRIDFCKKSY